MFDSEFARKKIETALDSGFFRFVVYPFGKNGVEIYRMLHDCYGIEDNNIILVDNYFSKYNDRIISCEELYEKNFQETIICITAENRELNETIIKKIETIIGKDQIINLFEREIVLLKTEKYDENDLRLLDLTDEGHDHKGIHILISSKNDVITIKSVIDELIVEKDIEIVLVVTCDIDDIKNQIHYNQLLVVGVNEYIMNYRKMRPSIFIIMHPYDKERRLYNIRTFAKKVIALYTGVYDGLNSDYLSELLKNGMEKYKPDYYLFDGYVFAQAQKIEWLRERAMRMGNPKYDAIYAAIKDRKSVVPKNKKNVFWATDHGVYRNYIAQDCTLDKYFKPIVNYAKENQDINIIFRPHPTLLTELRELGIWTSREILFMNTLFEKIGNITMDLSNTYENALKKSDAIITDGFCGIVLSSLPTMLPICRTFRSEKMIPTADYELQGYYDAFSTKDVVAFLDMIKNEKDPLLEERRKTCEKYVVDFSGNNGKKIKNLLCSFL